MDMLEKNDYSTDHFENCNFTKACSNHDNCYMYCGNKKKSRRECDANFFKDLAKAVKIGGKDQGCLKIAAMYSQLVQNYGEKSYNDAQDQLNNPCKECKNGVIINKKDRTYIDPCKICLSGKEQNAPDGSIPYNNISKFYCWVCKKGKGDYKENGIFCNDYNKCTRNDRCESGSCIGDKILSNEDPDCI